MGTSTTVIAPVGPETWTSEPPKIAGHETRDDGRDQARLRAEPGGDTERERERQRHDPHRETSQDVRTPARADAGVVRASRQEGAQVRHSQGTGRLPPGRRREPSLRRPGWPRGPDRSRWLFVQQIREQTLRLRQ